MAEHDWVVHKLALFHEGEGDDVYADYRGFRKPPIFRGARGRPYRPDVWVENDGLLYEVEPYLALKNSLSQIKAFSISPDVRSLVVVVCSGTDRGVERLEGVVERRDIDAEVINWRDLFDRLGISW